MMIADAKTGLPVAQALLVAAALTAALFLWEGRVGYNFSDEGFLWYGVQRIVQGEAPLRDYMAYDPARYYWAAAWAWVWGDSGIVALRAGVAVFQALGLFVAFMLTASVAGRRAWLFLMAAALVFGGWMLPRHKLFDISASIFLVGLLAALIAAPTRRRYFLTGIGLGLIALVGRNHGLYGLAGGGLAWLWLGLKRSADGQAPGLTEAALLAGAGVVVGFSPLALMIAVYPGFAEAFWRSILFHFELGATNLPLPVPRPWLVDINVLPVGQSLRQILVGLWFIALPLGGVLGLVCIIRRQLADRPVPPAFAAAALMMLPYAHYAYSRADVSHLAQGTFPMLIGTLTLLARQRPVVRGVLAAGFVAASLWVTVVFHPGWACSGDAQCATVTVASGEDLILATPDVELFGFLKSTIDRYAPGDAAFVAVPLWPGVYSLFQRKSPLWEIYPLFPRSVEFERAEIARLESARPRLALILDLAVDGRDDLRYCRTHPLICAYVREHFDRLPQTERPALEVYVARPGG